MTDWASSEYQEIVSRFRRLTSFRSEVSGLCCETVIDGMPECCGVLVQGTDLVFSSAEMMILGKPKGTFVLRPHEGSFIGVLNREMYTEDRLRRALFRGWIADTLECAAHPTRPVIGPGGEVIGVATAGCMAEYALDELKKSRRVFKELWSRAVRLTGMKPYYVTYDFRADWAML